MAHRRKFWHLCTGLLPILLGVLAVGGLLLGAQPASAAAVPTANVCMQTNYTNPHPPAKQNTQTLNCTANDVRVARALNINVISGGSCTNGTCTCNAVSPPPTTCASPATPGCITFSADYEVVLTAQTRYDIGIYFAVDGDSNGDGALTGQCVLSVIDDVNNSTANFVNLDAAPDVCGDIDNAHNPQLLSITLTVPCKGDADGKLRLPNCTSWRQPGSNEVCDEAADAFPGSPSKCNCSPGFTLDIFVETATIDVTKTPVPTTAPETGGDVVYEVKVKNLASQASVSLDTLCDDKYGDVTGNSDSACGAGPFQTIVTTDCTLTTIAAGATYTCHFTGTAPPGDTGDKFTDKVTACGTDDFGHAGLCDDGSADVTYTDVADRPTLTKTAKSATCVVDVTYEVAVTNNSAIDVLTLSSLSDDKFGSILAAHAAEGGYEEVVSSDCSVPQTLQPGADPSNPYKCTFVGRINTCSSHTNTVTGSATDDDGVTTDGTTTPPLQGSSTVTVTVGGLTQ